MFVVYSLRPSHLTPDHPMLLKPRSSHALAIRPWSLSEAARNVSRQGTTEQSSSILMPTHDYSFSLPPTCVVDSSYLFCRHSGWVSLTRSASLHGETQNMASLPYLRYTPPSMSKCLVVTVSWQAVSTRRVEQAAAGLYQHACAVMDPDQILGERGNLICWGENHALQTEVPRPVSAMESSFKEEHLNSQTPLSSLSCLSMPVHSADVHECPHALTLQALHPT